jgi:splicing factor 3B subunit 3
MQLYHLTLERATAIQAACFGSFTGAEVGHEFVMARGAQLELWRIVEDSCRLAYHQEMFGLVRSMQVFRAPGIDRDFLLLASDSGKVVLLQFSVEEDRFRALDLHAYGKSGCRRVVPGQLLACDLRGRAFMLSALEEQRLVYRVERAGRSLKLTSPI